LFLIVHNLTACTPVEHDAPIISQGSLTSYGLGEEVVAVDQANQRLLWINLETQTVSAEYLEGDFALIRPSQDGSALFIVHQDEEALDVITGPNATVRYDLDSPYNAFAESPSRDRLVFFHLGNPTGGFASNAGEISVVDLTRASEEGNPNRRTIHASQSGPLGVSFGASLDVDGESYSPALIHLSGRLALVALDHPGLAETLIPLSANPDTDGTKVRSLTFEDAPRTDGTLVAHTAVSGSSDLLSISLFPDVAQPAGRLPLSVQINAFGLSGTPILIHPFAASDGVPKVLVASLIPARLHLIDLNTGLVSSENLVSTPESLQLSDESGTDHDGRSVVITSAQKDLYILSEEELSATGFQSMRTVRLAGSIKHVVPCPGFGLLFVAYESFPGAAFVDLNRSDQVFPISLGAAVQDLELDENTGTLTLLDKSSPSNLIQLTLHDLHPEVTNLSFSASQMFRLPETKKLAVEAKANDFPEGAVSFLDFPLGEDAQEEAITFTGLAYHDLLDPREVQE
jgi:hypothetical protein